MDSLKDKKMLLIGKCMEYLRDYIKEIIPEEGSFGRHNVFFSYPGTSYEAVTWVENGGGYRYLCIGMVEKGDDRLVHHYFAKGSNSDLITRLEDRKTAEEIYVELEQLKTAVDNLE